MDGLKIALPIFFKVKPVAFRAAKVALIVGTILASHQPRQPNNFRKHYHRVLDKDDPYMLRAIYSLVRNSDHEHYGITISTLTELGLA